MNRSLFILILSGVFIFTCGAAYSAIVVEEVTGEAALRSGSQWVALQKGQTLAEGSKISTGVNSTAVLKIDNATLTVRPMTMMKIFRNSADKEAGTHIGLKFGSLNAKVKKIGTLKTNFKISTPVATSSVRGTEEVVSYGPENGMTVEVVSGDIDTETNNGQSNTISGNQVFNMGTQDVTPDNLFEETHNNSLMPLYDPNNIDEQPIQDFVSDDTVGSGDAGTFDVIDIIDDQINASSRVNIDIEW